MGRGVKSEEQENNTTTGVIILERKVFSRFVLPNSVFLILGN